MASSAALAVLAALSLPGIPAAWSRSPAPAGALAGAAVPPRVDRVSLYATRFEPDGSVVTWLYVQGANIDAEAEALVDGVVQPTASHKVLQNDLYGVSPQALGYPIHHYRALMVAPGRRSAGATLQVRVRNRDGQTSGPLEYRLPLDAATMDSDGDDILDTWERSGYDPDGDGTLEVNLPALGADPYRPDLLLEVDIMQGLDNHPRAAVFETVRQAFAAAPLMNPVSPSGVNLIVDTTGTVPFTWFVDFGPRRPAWNQYVDFYALKAVHFDERRRGRLYHYCIWGNMRENRSSGRSDFNPTIALPGDDCMVTFDDFNDEYQTIRSGAETLMHELGHNLLQRHGGTDDFQFRPHYNSVMSYSWQLRTGHADTTRAKMPICTPFYYAQAAAVEDSGAVPQGAGTAVDYSEGMGGRHPLTPYPNGRVGVCTDSNAGATADGGATEPGQGAPPPVAADYPNWRRLDFSGPRRNGRFEVGRTGG
jgi:hypothetical protein